jgi:tRNA-dihydrouridine synthase 3
MHSPTPVFDEAADKETSPFAGKVYLTALKLFGNLPFRLLCVEFGAQGTLSEMIVAREVVKGLWKPRAMMRRHESERFFGIQLVGADPAVMAESAAVAESEGADFIDLNMACPRLGVVKRGAGASLLRHPRRIREIVAAVVRAVRIPVTVKLRAGWEDGKPTLERTLAAAVEGGAAAAFIHPRSREQHYRRPADWSLVAAAVRQSPIPIIGNGDIFHPDEALRRRRETGCAGIAIGRGALIKPWIFLELRLGRTLDPDAEQRLEWLRRYARFLLEHFGNDRMGRDRARWFFSQQQQFLSRYIPVGAVDYRQVMQTRPPGFTPRSPLEALLARRTPEAIEELAALVGLQPEPD